MTTSTAPSDRERELTAVFAELADTMVDDYDVVDLLHRLAMHCVSLLDIAAAGLLLTDGQGRLRLLASSNEQARLIELFQLQGDVPGPCAEAFETSRRVDAVDLSLLEHHDRWPAFVEEARRLGFQTVHAQPMQLRSDTIGSLNLFRSTSTSLGEDDLLLGAALADVATIGILHQRALRRTETLVEQLQGALNSRIVIEQAKGMLADRADIETHEAFDMLRNHARANRQLLGDLANQVIRDRQILSRIIADSNQKPGKRPNRRQP